MFAVPPWANYQAAKSSFDVEHSVDQIYLFKIAGPTSLQTRERSTGEDLRDIGFLRFRPTTVAGLQTEICRIGMAGTLAYELHGPLEEGPQVYDAVVRAGADLGLQRLGWRTYTVNHVEGGFPQLIWTFMFTAVEDPGFIDFVGGGESIWAPIVSGLPEFKRCGCQTRQALESSEAAIAYGLPPEIVSSWMGDGATTWTGYPTLGDARRLGQGIARSGDPADALPPRDREPAGLGFGGQPVSPAGA
jgi:hypothetical protein